MEKYLLTIEFRYFGVVDFYGEPDYSHKKKTITIGLFDTYGKACVEGNKLLEKLEERYPVHVFPDGRKGEYRFSKDGGPFGFKNYLASNLAYLNTPFEFFAKIETMIYSDIDETIDSIEKDILAYKEFK